VDKLAHTPHIINTPSIPLPPQQKHQGKNRLWYTYSYSLPPITHSLTPIPSTASTTNMMSTRPSVLERSFFLDTVNGRCTRWRGETGGERARNFSLVREEEEEDMVSVLLGIGMEMESVAVVVEVGVSV
jgi:hypothetical protein